MKTVNYFKALGDETRLRLLNLALFQEFNVYELMTILDMGQSRISRHLKILSDSSLLISRRDGLWVFYRAADSGDGNKLIQAISYLFRPSELLEQDIERAEIFLQEGRKESSRFFDALAPDWDALKSTLLADFDLQAEILNQLEPCRTAADLGCGTGSLLPGLLSKAERVIGVDSSPKMLEQAGKGDNRIELRLGQLEHLPLREGEVDCVLINLVLHHLPTPLIGLQEAARVLSAGGRLILVDFYQHSHERLRSEFGDRWLGFSSVDIDGWIRDSGFRLQDHNHYPLKEGIQLFIYKLEKISKEGSKT